MVEKEQTFSEIYRAFISSQESNKQDSFTAACSTWLQFETAHVRIDYTLFTI
jgi:hypothetical protein